MPHINDTPSLIEYPQDTASPVFIPHLLAFLQLGLPAGSLLRSPNSLLLLLAPRLAACFSASLRSSAPLQRERGTREVLPEPHALFPFRPPSASGCTLPN